VIERWHFLFSGFNQSRRYACGMESLWLSMRRIATPDVSVQFNDWNADIEAIAQFCCRCSKPAPDIFVYGYSWGGNAALELCDRLGKKDLHVRHLVLCDAVRRTPIMPKWAPLSVLSMTNWLKLEVPKTVAAVTYFTQKQNKPAGHRVVAEGEYTKIINGGTLQRRHEDMDEAPEFTAACARIAGL
jgi:pimeloyl-ACP methyl ester carboxylesterase